MNDEPKKTTDEQSDTTSHTAEHPHTDASLGMTTPQHEPAVTHEAQPESVTPGAASEPALPLTSTVSAPAPVVWQGYAIAAVLIVLMSAGVWYVLEKNDRVTTNVLTGLFTDTPSETDPVVMVNGEPITTALFTTTVKQIETNAVAQGADLADPAIKEQIADQALTMLVNTELLMQAADTAGIEVTEAQIDARIAEIETNLGGPEALEAELVKAEVTIERLREDVLVELTVQTLLESVTAGDAVAVTDAEVEALYEQAGGEAAGNPPLAEVRDQVVAQIEATRQQEQVQVYLETLRSEAEIEELL